MMSGGRRWLGSPRGPWLLALFILALPVAVALPVASMGRMMMGPPSATADQLAAAPGISLDAAVLLTGVPINGVASGTLLEHLDSATYSRTERVVQVRDSAETPVVMGQAGDIRAGAVIQVRG